MNELFQYLQTLECLNFSTTEFRGSRWQDIGCDTTGHLADCRNVAIFKIFKTLKKLNKIFGIRLAVVNFVHDIPEF